MGPARYGAGVEAIFEVRPENVKIFPQVELRAEFTDGRLASANFDGVGG